MTDSEFNQEQIADNLPEQSETVNLDWEVYDNTFYIYNFEVPDDLQRSGIGSSLLSEIKSLCEEFDIGTIEAHIDLTHRDETGTYPSGRSVENDPTIEFLQDQGFILLNYSRSETVHAKWTR